MAQKSRKSRPAADDITPAAVVKWLKANPVFFEEHSDSLSALFPARFDGENNVADMQDFALRRLRAELDRKRSRESLLLEAAEENALVQERVHQAALAILDAGSLDGLLSLITDELPDLFGIEAAVLCLEEAKQLFPGDDDIFLRAADAESERIFAGVTDDIGSYACMRINGGKAAPDGYLALGAADPQAFQSGQGTELLTFFARLLERCLATWLNRENQ